MGGIKKSIDKNGNMRMEIMNKSNFRSIMTKLKVLARATAYDKLCLVVGLKELGANVCVTGEGLNDVEALKNSNVGFAMGESGCDLAKESSDIIITNDDFNVVYKA